MLYSSSKKNLFLFHNAHESEKTLVLFRNTLGEFSKLIDLHVEARVLDYVTVVLYLLLKSKNR